MDPKQPKDNEQAPTLPPINRKSMKSGLITLGAVSEQDMPETAVRESINFHFDAIGAATLRPGTTSLGNNIAATNILGLYYYVDTVNSSPKTQMISVSGTTASFLNSGSWTSIRSGLTANKKARFTTFLNYVFMVNGADATAVWDGTVPGSGGAFITTGNASGAPIAQFIENFRGRVWAMGNPSYPSRLFYSSIPSAAATPVITWSIDPVTGQWIDISPQDGDFPTGLQRFRNVMLCFKTNRLYRVFDIGQVDPDPYYAVGTSSQESIIETKAGVFFHHASGIYQYNIYGVVQEVSRPIIDIIKAIPTSSYPNIAAWLDVQGDHVCWSIGNVTVRGITYTNLVIRFTISTQTWTHYQYPTQILTSVRRQPFYTDGTTQFAVTGDSAGNVMEMDTGKLDVGNKSIPFSLIHRWETCDTLLSTRKNIQTINFAHIGGAESTVGYQTEVQDPDDLSNWTHGVGRPSMLKTINTGFNAANVKGRKVRFRVWGQSLGQPFAYNGYELIGVQNEIIQFT